MNHIDALESRTLFAAVLPGFADSTIASGLNSPTAMTFAPDGRLFVAEQTGALRIVKNNALLSRNFAAFKVDSAGERGLLGVAVDSDFSTNHFVYVYYTSPARHGVAAHNRVSRVTADGDRFVRGSETVLLELDNLSTATNHNGGSIGFGPDGKLYVGVGENAKGSNSQSTSNLLGKILRINPDGTIPSDNPFPSAKGVNKAIWAIGLRNPFNFAFQAGTRVMYINDVGQNTYEEVNVGVAGSNYGWPETEGPTHRRRYRAPIFYYGHGDGPLTGNAIVGAAFYNPLVRTFPKNYRGDYFFADLTSGWIRRLDTTTHEAANFASGITLPVALAVKNDGSLYYLARGVTDSSGIVGRIAAV